MRSLQVFLLVLLGLFPLYQASQSLKGGPATVFEDFSKKFYEGHVNNLIFSYSDLISLVSFVDDLKETLLVQQEVNPNMTALESGTFALDFLSKQLESIGQSNSMGGIEFYKIFSTLVTDRYQPRGQGNHSISRLSPLNYDHLSQALNRADLQDLSLLASFLDDDLIQEEDQAIPKPKNLRAETVESSSNDCLPKRKVDDINTDTPWIMLIDLISVIPQKVTEFSNKIKDDYVSEAFRKGTEIYDNLDTRFNNLLLSNVGYSESLVRFEFESETGRFIDSLTHISDEELKDLFVLELLDLFDEFIAKISRKFNDQIPSKRSKNEEKKENLFTSVSGPKCFDTLSKITIKSGGIALAPFSVKNASRNPFSTSSASTLASAPEVVELKKEEDDEDFVDVASSEEVLSPENQAIFNNPLEHFMAAFTDKSDEQFQELRSLYWGLMEENFKSLETKSLSLLTDIVDNAIKKTYSQTRS